MKEWVVCTWLGKIGRSQRGELGDERVGKGRGGRRGERGERDVVDINKLGTKGFNIVQESVACMSDLIEESAGNLVEMSDIVIGTGLVFSRDKLNVLANHVELDAITQREASSGGGGGGRRERLAGSTLALRCAAG